MAEDGKIYHIPALLQESVNGLDIVPDGCYVDVTFGGGGHSRAIISRLGDKGRLYGFDQDMDAYANRIDDSRFTFVHGNFAYISNFCATMEKRLSMAFLPISVCRSIILTTNRADSLSVAMRSSTCA